MSAAGEGYLSEAALRMMFGLSETEIRALVSFGRCPGEITPTGRVRARRRDLRAWARALEPIPERRCA